MKINLIKILMLISLVACGYHISFGQQLKIIKKDILQELLHQKNDTTYVVNFWATWCKPCVAELPVFEGLQSNSNSKKVKVILISLDFIKDKSKTESFIKSRKMKSPIYLLDEPDYNAWINKVDSSWGGSIPFTVIYNHQKQFKKTFENEINSNLLQSVLKSIPN